MNSRVTFVTPTYARDIERFVLQRESMERCNIEIPHVAIVNHEDIELFHAIRFQKNLTILSTRDILPRKLEDRRLGWGARRREIVRYWKGRNPIHGWMAQQLLKLGAAKLIKTEAMVCLDSDTFFVQRVTDEDFHDATGRVHLYETQDDIDAEMAEWYVKSLRFLGIPLQKTPVRRYTHSPVPFRRDIVIEMCEYIEKKHGQHWMEAMLSHEQIFEYSTYGAYARHLAAGSRVVPVKPELCLYFWWQDEIQAVTTNLVKKLKATPKAKAILVNSNGQTSVETYRALIETVWDSVEAEPQVVA